MKLNIPTIVSILAFIAFVAFAALTAVNLASSVQDTPTHQDETSAMIAWHVALTGPEQADLCNLYLTMPKERILEAFTTGDDPMHAAEAEAFYAVMHEECG
jgi:hypothetical protein